MAVLVLLAAVQQVELLQEALEVAVHHQAALQLAQQEQQVKDLQVAILPVQ